ncbi:Spy/CpxP family protein refolding chaperone [Nitrosomonas marina]|nr:Spy/CpxP family protein refolding chaperone [Nitrosomonas marina]
MLYRNPLVITLSCFAFFILSGPASLVSASQDAALLQENHNRFLLAEANHHGHDKETKHASNKKDVEGHGKDSHDNDHNSKKDDKHGGKKGGMKKHMHDYAHLIIPHADKLKLTDEQLGKITRLHLKHKKLHKKVKDALQDSMKAFKKASLKPGTSDAELRDLGKAVTKAFNDMIEHHIKERNAVHTVLTETQLKQLNSIKIKHDHESHDDENGGHGGH